jgi:hypothetical protein
LGFQESFSQVFLFHPDTSSKEVNILSLHETLYLASVVALKTIHLTNFNLYTIENTITKVFSSINNVSINVAIVSSKVNILSNTILALTKLWKSYPSIFVQDMALSLRENKQLTSNIKASNQSNLCNNNKK